MSRLVEQYQHPDGELDEQNADQLAAEIRSSVQRNRDSAPLELMSSLVGKLQRVGGGKSTASGSDDEDDVQAGEQTVSGNKIDIGASIRLRHICRGWEDKKRVDADENGSVVLNVALDRRGMLPTVWGDLDHCRVKRSETELELTGDVRVHFGTTAPRVGLKALKDIGYLVSFDGTVLVKRGDEQTEVDTGLNFRILRNESEIQLKVDLADGTNVVLSLDRQTLEPLAEPMVNAGLRTRDVSWDCELNLDDVNGSCADETDVDSVVTW